MYVFTDTYGDFTFFPPFPQTYGIPLLCREYIFHCPCLKLWYDVVSLSADRKYWITLWIYFSSPLGLWSLTHPVCGTLESLLWESESLVCHLTEDSLSLCDVCSSLPLSLPLSHYGSSLLFSIGRFTKAFHNIAWVKSGVGSSPLDLLSSQTSFFRKLKLKCNECKSIQSLTGNNWYSSCGSINKVMYSVGLLHFTCRIIQVNENDNT